MVQVHHKKLTEIACGQDPCLTWVLPSRYLAVHYGNLVAANRYFERSLKLYECMVDDPERAIEAYNVTFQPLGQTEFGYILGRSEQCRPLFTKAGLNWQSIDTFVDKMVVHTVTWRPRGDT